MPTALSFDFEIVRFFQESLSGPFAYLCLTATSKMR